MHTTPLRPARRAAATVTAVAAGALLALGLAAPAQAHDQLIGSAPSEGEVLDAAPTEVSAVFSAELLDTGATLIVADSEGVDRAIGEPEIDGDTVSVPVDDEMAPGDAEIRWRVVSSDGHPIEGVIPFSVEAAATASATPSSAAEPSATATDEPSATPSATESAPAAVDDASGAGPMPFVLGGIALAAVAAILFAVLRRRTPPTAQDDSTGNDGA
ncbi:copper resistance CopC family protein [Mycetocola reblochoni]|uniref:Copper resistance protein CopC n=1 Tax=Mycetocola reblochoni REB411 TaxID=1255698 RepID=A0A1R4JWD7_9MICO|nr:copper resistance CopC family protein [Mycetocola reblochoni]SJN36289.1 Copper resistance protein CopC [Mycetocola reblochoni REB411]